MKAPPKQPRLVCLRCEGEEFQSALGTVTQEFRGDTLQVEAPVHRCVNCGWETLAPGQLDPLRLRVADTYRRNHGLLTSDEIKARRASLRMSQRDFARYLRVGEASIPRWEGPIVQDPSSDELIRAKTDQEAAMAAVLSAINTLLPLHAESQVRLALKRFEVVRGGNSAAENFREHVSWLGAAPYRYQMVWASMTIASAEAAPSQLYSSWPRHDRQSSRFDESLLAPA